MYALYDQRNAPPELREPVLEAIAAGGGSLVVSRVAPGSGENDVLPLLISALGTTVDVIRCHHRYSSEVVGPKGVEPSPAGT